MWPMILLMSHLPGDHSMFASRRPEKLGYHSRQSADRHYQGCRPAIPKRRHSVGLSLQKPD